MQIFNPTDNLSPESRPMPMDFTIKLYPNRWISIT